MDWTGWLLIPLFFICLGLGVLDYEEIVCNIINYIIGLCSKPKKYQ